MNILYILGTPFRAIKDAVITARERARAKRKYNEGVRQLGYMPPKWEQTQRAIRWMERLRRKEY